MNPPPKYLNDDGQELWPLVLAELQSRGRLDAPNERRAGRYCQLQSQWLRVTQYLNTHGQVVEIRDSKGEVKGQTTAPEYSIQSDLETKLARFEKDFGFIDPPQKASKTSPGQAATQGDPVAALRNRLAELASGQSSRN